MKSLTYNNMREEDVVNWARGALEFLVGGGETSKHSCEVPEMGSGWDHGGYGAAITYVIEDGDGFFWAGNSEYDTKVNFCPFCGRKAPNTEVVPTEGE